MSYFLGKVVRVSDWPGTKGERYLVVEPYQSKKYGECVWVRRLDRGYPGPWSCVPLANLSLDKKANRQLERAVEIAQGSRCK